MLSDISAIVTDISSVAAAILERLFCEISTAVDTDSIFDETLRTFSNTLTAFFFKDSVSLSTCLRLSLRTSVEAIVLSTSTVAEFTALCKDCEVLDKPLDE